MTAEEASRAIVRAARGRGCSGSASAIAIAFRGERLRAAGPADTRKSRPLSSFRAPLSWSLRSIGSRSSRGGGGSGPDKALGKAAAAAAASVPIEPPALGPPATECDSDGRRALADLPARAA